MSDYRYNYNNSPGPGPGNQRPPRGDDTLSGLRWAIGVGLIFLSFPIGLFFTIAHSMGHDIIGNILRGLSGQSSKSRQSAYTSPEQARQQAQSYQSGTQKTQQSAGVRRADRGSTVKTVFGWIMVAFGALGAVSAIMSYETVWTMLTMIALALGGGALVLSAAKSRKLEAKFRRCITISGNRGVVDIKKLSKTLGVDLTEADKMLTEMVDRGYYGQRAYIDHERCLLVIDPEEMRDVYRREDEAKKAAAAAKEKAQTAEEKEKMSEYERYIDLIHQADVDIEDEAMSEKIRRMKAITAAIFREVEAHPEKRSQIDRFMNYYLPTTLKLLKSYARIEAQGVSGENMDKAKADIEGIADTLVAGYEKQLDKLYRAEAMDIAGDVSVIENMLKRDGLTGQTDFGQTLGGH